MKLVKTYLKTTLLLFIVTFSSCKEDNQTQETPQPVENQDGYNMLLIGNSFFKPYAEKLDDLSVVYSQHKVNY